MLKATTVVSPFELIYFFLKKGRIYVNLLAVVGQHWIKLRYELKGLSIFLYIYQNLMQISVHCQVNIRGKVEPSSKCFYCVILGVCSLALSWEGKSFFFQLQCTQRLTYKNCGMVVWCTTNFIYPLFEIYS